MKVSAILSVYFSNIFSWGKKEILSFLYFKEFVLFRHFILSSSIQKLIPLLSAEGRRPDESCRIETKDGEIQGQKTDTAFHDS